MQSAQADFAIFQRRIHSLQHDSIQKHLSPPAPV
jgi:hypothetical protein